MTRDSTKTRGIRAVAGAVVALALFNVNAGALAMPAPPEGGSGVPVTHAPAPSASEVVRIARAYATGSGDTIDRRGENQNMFTKWFGLDGSPWCAMFVSYVFDHAGVPLKGKGSALSTDWRDGVVFSQGRGQRFTYKLSALHPGDVLWRPREEGAGHVGIVVKVQQNGVYVVEGNGGHGGDDVVRTVRYGANSSWTRVTRAPGL